jgi:hypothetical protein
MSGLLNSTGAVSGVLGTTVGTPAATNAADVGAGVLPVGVTGGSGLTALGTVTSANLSNNDIVMPRFKEFDSFHDATLTSTTTAYLETLNISHSQYNQVTVEATSDILEMSFMMNHYAAGGYSGYGIQRATDTGFTANVATMMSSGEHGLGQHGLATSDGSAYMHIGGTWNQTCTWATPDTTYYLRMIGMTHAISGTTNWGNGTADSTNSGVYMTVKRWSIV